MSSVFSMASAFEVGELLQHAFPVALLDAWLLFAQQAAGYAFQAVHEVGGSHLWRILHQQVDMVALTIHLDQLHLEVGTDFGEDDVKPPMASH